MYLPEKNVEQDARYASACMHACLEPEIELVRRVHAGGGN